MIRPATIEDTKQIRPLLEQLSGHLLTPDEVVDRIRFVQNSQFDELYVFVDKARPMIILGLLAFRIRENIEEVSRYGEISAVVVDETVRKQGIGKQLIEFAEQLAKDRNCIGTWLVSGFGREEQAHPFYKASGYTVTGYRFVKKFSVE